jgi:hypothetical protein
MDMTVFHCPIRCDERLAYDLSAKDALGALLGASSPEQIEFDLLEIEEVDQGLKGGGQWELQRSMGKEAGRVPDSVEPEARADGRSC